MSWLKKPFCPSSSVFVCVRVCVCVCVCACFLWVCYRLPSQIAGFVCAEGLAWYPQHPIIYTCTSDLRQQPIRMRTVWSWTHVIERQTPAMKSLTIDTAASPGKRCSSSSLFLFLDWLRLRRHLPCRICKATSANCANRGWLLSLKAFCISHGLIKVLFIFAVFPVSLR